MKDLRLLQKLFFLLLLGCSLSTIQACGDDDEEDEIMEEPTIKDDSTIKEDSIIKNELIGTWKSYFSTGYQVKCFRADGTGYRQEYDEADGGWHDKKEFDYTYYKELGKLILTDKEETKTYIYKVISLSSEVLELEDPDGNLDTYYRVEDAIEPTPVPDKTKRLVKILEEKAKRYSATSKLKKYTYIYEFDYNDEGYLSSATYCDDDGYTEVIEYKYSGNEISNEEVTYKLFNGKVSLYDDNIRSNYYKLDYGFSNYEQLNKIGEDDFIVSWNNNRITKIGRSDSNYDLPFQTYSWYNTYTYEGKTCNGFIDIDILGGFSEIFNLDAGKVMSDVIMLVHPELFGLKINQLPKSSKEDIYVYDYDEETGEESISDDFKSYTYAYEFDDDGYLKKVTKTNENANDEFISHTYTWE